MHATQLHHLRIASLDGTELAVVSNGRAGLPAIIFIHGTCSSHNIWQGQFNDPILHASFHLIAFDLRGHGTSDKPNAPEFYSGSERWAGDLNAVIQYFSLPNVFLVAWSYAGRVVCDYLKVYGESKVSGINFIAAGTLANDEVKGPGYRVLAALFDEDEEQREIAEKQFVADLSKDVMTGVDQTQMFIDISRTPLYVRLFMRNRVMNYEQTLAKLQTPVLLTHGKKDSYSLPLLAELLEQHIPNARVSWYLDDGHIPFISSPSRYNEELLTFVQQTLIDGNNR